MRRGLFSSLFILGALVACGQTGPLYLPEEEPPAESSETKTQETVPDARAPEDEQESSGDQSL